MNLLENEEKVTNATFFSTFFFHLKEEEAEKPPIY